MRTSKGAKDVIAKALRGVFPVEIDNLYAFVLWGRVRRFSSAKQIVSLIEPMIAELEAKLNACKIKRLGHPAECL